MFGLRDDDCVTMSQTLSLALECMPDFANFYSTMAYPGSALYGQAVQKGWTLPVSWRGYSQHNDDCRPLDTEHLSGKEVLEYRDAAFNSFFRDPRYLAHVERKFGAETRAHVESMTTYKLKRKLTEAAA
jgi:anaerobic magnesium-protoporphyrin IX monomethyl ester cyclase